jgi:hypothetical protein
MSAQSSREATMRRYLFTTLLLVFAQPAFAGDNDKLYGSTLDERTVLAFKVSDAAVQKMLPVGWQVDSPTAGPSKGSNLVVVLVDQLLAQDSEGKPVDAVHGAALVVPAKKQGMDKGISMVVGGLFSPAGYAPGPYGVFVHANADIERKVHTDPAGSSIVEESWAFKADTGGSIQLHVQYTRGVPARGKVEAPVYSAAKPDFYRIYRFEQAVDVVRSTATGTDRIQKLSFNASGQQLSPLFDGSEQLISVTSVPFYSRQIYLPGEPAVGSSTPPASGAPASK